MFVRFMCLAFLLLLSCNHLSRRAPDSVSPLTNECREFIKKLNSEWQYGWITVPTDPQDVTPLSIFYYHRPNPKAVPTIFFNGGPGQPSWKAIEFLMSRYSVERSWFIFMDQRGTGCSTHYPKGELDRRYLPWGTKGIVRDAELLRHHLGIEKWNIFGQSFGSSVVFRYLDDAPTAVVKAVAHGGAPLGNIHERLSLRYESQIYIIKEFLRRFPQAREAVRKIVRKRICLSRDKVPICGARSINEAVYMFMYSLADWPTFARILTDVSQQKNSFQASLPISKILQTNEWMPWDSSLSVLQFMEGYDRRTVNYNRLRQLGIRELGDVEMLSLTQIWTGGVRDERNESRDETSEKKLIEEGYGLTNLENIRANLIKNPSIEFYLYSSQYDFFGPRVEVERAAQRIGSRVQYKELVGKAHGAYLDEEVVSNLLIPSTTN